MTIRKIIFPDNPILRQKAQRVGRITRATQTLIDDMIETMRKSSGVGLAAPQVAISERLIVVEPRADDDDEEPGSSAVGQGPLYVVINPEIVKVSTEMAEGVEGCLSIPNWYGNVMRHVAITVKGYDRFGVAVRYKLTDWSARIFQHEIDHLNGVLFIDHIREPLDIWRVNEHGERISGPVHDVLSVTPD